MIYQRVFVDSRTEVFHTDLDCAASRRAYRWCAAAAAHRSRLRGCPQCAVPLCRKLDLVVGRIPSGAKKSMSLPRLHPIEGRSDPADDLDQSNEIGDGPSYGNPGDVDDPRFNSASSTGWGTSFYGQNPDEYLGGPTDDDNDWRGGSSMYE